ncbi:MAG: (2Fe-2S)-binding protein [Planctomycetes bacterium]|nr:(2Fe-2S)-binding protein [Planctomycetota bacterium]MBI3834443.1 (2Fe-2S)-binding protein [Planctomycetota bacterium]
MQPDDKICYCYGVSLRKLVNYSLRVRPERPSQMTGCLNAGTGCGWCIPFLVKIAENPEVFLLEGMTPDDYAERRKSYIKSAPKNTF